MNMIEFSIGKKNPIEREGMFIQADESGLTLFMTLDHLTEKEIEGCKKGSISIDLVYLKDIVFFVTKIEGFEVSDASFVANNSSFKPVENVEEGTGYPFQIILTESTTGIIKAMRLVSFNTRFSRELNKCIKDQLNKPFDKDMCNRNLSTIMNTYSSKDLLKFSIVNTKYR